MVKLQVSCLVIFSLVGLSCACQNGVLLRSGGLTCEEKQEIIDTHNHLRQQVALGNIRGQPSAENMLEMSWDDELARGAQRWADNCVFKHNSYEERKVSRFQVGQNLAIVWTYPYQSKLGDTPVFVKSINNWFDEVNYYSGYFTPKVGHYSQVVWGETFLVGCGYSYFLQDKKYTKYYVCNYGPAGNIKGAFPYKKGPPSCSHYGATPSNKYAGLCRNKYFKSQACSHNHYYYFGDYK